MTLYNEILIGDQFAVRLLEEIEKAQFSIYILMYGWKIYTNDNNSLVQKINIALSEKRKQGVKIKGIVQHKGAELYFSSLGLDIKSWKKGSLMHSKLVYIDNKDLFIGSHNLTTNGTYYNLETSVFIRGLPLKEVEKMNVFIYNLFL